MIINFNNAICFIMEVYPTIKVIYDRRRVSGKGKGGTVEVEIYFQKKRKWISTGVRVVPANWHPAKRIIARMDANDLNLRIANVENFVNGYIRKLVVDNAPFTWSGLETAMDNNRGEDSFIKFVKDLVDRRMDITESTRKNHRKFYKALVEFKKIREFADITRPNITLYDEWLHCRGAYTQATVASYHKFMKVYINEAIRREIITVNPYAGMKIDRGKSGIRKFLTREELDMIENVALPSLSLQKVRDLFLFQSYTGLAYADMDRFDFRNVQLRNGRHVIHDLRQKTKEDFYIVLLPKAIDILEKYGYKLPLISNQQYNLRLKIVGDAAGLEKSLTSHMGRHTYATMCLNSGIKIEVLAGMMGHSDIKTTQIYARLVNQTVENAYDTLEEADAICRMADGLTGVLRMLSGLPGIGRKYNFSL